MFGSCHLNRAWNVEIGVECQIFVIVIFFYCSRVLLFGAHSSLYTQRRQFLVIGTIFMSVEKNQNKHSPLSPNDMNQALHNLLF